MVGDIRADVQREAVDSAVKAFKKAGRGKVIMPCGTGKTRVGLQVMNRLKVNLTLVLCPALSLVKQNLDCYLQTSATTFDTLVVCSDDTVLSSARDEYGIEAATTTSPHEIRQTVKRANGPLVIFATYQSAEQIAAAWKRSKLPPFDLIVFDEAHRTAGLAGVFNLGLHDKNIPAKKRLYLTATPRTMRAATKTRANSEGYEVVCMDDETLYGKEFYRLEFSRAVELGLLTDYRVIVFGVTSAMAAEWRTNGFDESVVAARIGLIKAMEKYKIRKVISYHSATKRSQAMAGLTEEKEPSFTDLFGHMKLQKHVSGNAWCKALDGKTTVHVRKAVLDELSALPNSTRAVVANCKVLGEGVDAPAVDAVAFMDPKSAVTEIVQAVGRCMRLCEGKHHSYVIVPVFLPDGATDVSEASSSRWTQLIHVIRALRDHDSRLQATIDQYRLRDPDKTERPIDEEEPIVERFSQIDLSDLPPEWLRRLEPRLIDRLLPQNWTDERLHAIVKAHIEQYGTSPTSRTSNVFMNASKWLATNHNSSLPKWLDANGYGRSSKYVSWSEQYVHQIVKAHIKQYGTSPAIGSSTEFRKCNHWLATNHNSSLPKWLDANGYGRKAPTSEWTLPKIDDLVKKHILLHSRSPARTTSNEFKNADHWLIRHHNSSLAKWLDHNGYGRARHVDMSIDKLNRMIDDYIQKYGRSPAIRSTKEFANANDWLIKHYRLTLPQWLDHNGYGRAKRGEVWSEQMLHKFVNTHVKSFRVRPTAADSKTFANADSWLRRHGSSLAKWLDANGYGRAGAAK